MFFMLLRNDPFLFPGAKSSALARQRMGVAQERMASAGVGNRLREAAQ
ncbi:MAG: hypothetical protein ACI9JZ_001821, partial [Lentimonas sp.]